MAKTSGRSFVTATALFVVGLTLIQRASATCPAGFRIPEASSWCTGCLPGTYSGPDSRFCSTCPENTFSASLASSCTACPAGSTSNPGSASGEGATQCEACPAGQFSWEGASACCSCCSGFYSDHAGASSCAQCSTAGAYSVVGATSASACSSYYLGGQLPAPAPGLLPAVSPRPAQLPVYGVSADGRGYLRGSECVDVRTDLESCGGCVADDSPLGARNADGGRDCSAIPHTGRVACRGAQSCASGFALSEDGEACVASNAAGALHVQRRAVGHRARRSAASL
ncbi:uncharacterized protein BXZ73DRAFT_92698 [Epithele typhae]|uniref:uncharacterized protein n=1 Tax=Epithele typhae TaxID=378194 RepID=UPI0020073A53|nr:uncharacterized protein BXZ73DRAFT_92698 [Epithele typhae]KAH9915046.1 hypothetical protein BXZ73DRAFT_92698 [Epithele typhae]